MKPRVLLIAEAANPEWVSVPLVGWNIATHLRGVADVHIVTQIRNRDAFLRHGLVEGTDFTAIDSEAIAAPFYKLAELLRGGSGKGWTTLTALQSVTYPYFEFQVWSIFGERIRNHDFDIVHRITPLTPTAPSILATRCKKSGVPFILGPLNGGLPWPKEFTTERLKEKEWLSFARSLYSYLPLMSSTYRNAAAIIVGSRHTEQELRRYNRPLVYVPENAIDAATFNHHNPVCQSQQTLRAAFVGRLVPYKGADIAIRACTALAEKGALTLDIIGDGPELESLRELCAALNLGDSVTFHGWLPHAQVAEYLRRTDLFVFPSVREFGGGVVLEAMACGAVPVIVDYGGPGELVNKDCGVKVPLAAKEDLIGAITTAIDDLYSDRQKILSLSLKSRERIANYYTWNAKAAQISAVYEWTISGQEAGKVPSFPFDEDVIQSATTE